LRPYPWAYRASVFILCLILISSITFCLETMHNFENVPERVYMFFIIECICIMAFSAEYVLKLLCAPKFPAFLAGGGGHLPRIHGGPHSKPRRQTSHGRWGCFMLTM